MSKQGLDAAGHLLLAAAHLRKAREQIALAPWHGAVHKADGEILYAINATRHAQELLKQEEEEPCKP